MHLYHRSRVKAEPGNVVFMRPQRPPIFSGHPKPIRPFLAYIEQEAHPQSGSPVSLWHFWWRSWWLFLEEKATWRLRLRTTATGEPL
jgi:hypothetical protein